MKRILTGIFIALLAAALSPAQQQLDFVSGLSDYQHIRQTLYHYLCQRGHRLLEQRRAAIARLASPADVARRRAYVRRRMIAMLGGLPGRTPLDARVVGVLHRDGYRIEKILFESQPHFYVTANLYVPTTGHPPYPGVLYPLGHEPGGKSYPIWQQMLGALAKKGYVALTWDPLAEGERDQLYDADFERRKLIRATTEHTMLGIQCLLVGDNLARYTIWDGMRALDYLLSRSEVDKTRIACTGNSGGGTLTAYLSALDDRIQVAMPSCFLTSWGRLLDTIGPQDAEQVLVPWLGAGLDHPDFVLCFAPKPYLMLTGIRDFFSIAGARSTYREAQRIYGLFGAAAKMAKAEEDTGHGYHQPNRLVAYRWLGRWLKGAPDTAGEPPVQIAEFRELACTKTGQVSTSLGGETVFQLNRKRAEALDPNLPRITGPGSVGAFQREIRARVRRLSGIEYHPGPVRTLPYGTIQRNGYRIEKLVYESEPGILIPSLLFLPEGGAARKPALVWVSGRGKSADAGAGGEIEWFVRQGRAVLAIDARGLGESRRLAENKGADFPNFFGDYDNAMTALLIGHSLVGMRAADIRRGVDLLAARKEIDANRISVVGKGTGAIPALYAAALDGRLRKVALEGMLVSYRVVIEHRIHRDVLEGIVPGALKAYDLPDLVAGLVPRPVVILDPVDPMGKPLWIAPARKAYAGAAAAYRAAGARTALRVLHRRPGASPGTVYRGWLAARPQPQPPA